MSFPSQEMRAFERGPRCRVCSRLVFPEPGLDEEDLCHMHKKSNTGFEGWLADICVDFQEDLLGLLVKQYGEPQLPDLSPTAQRNATIKGMVRRATLTIQKCEVSLIFLLSRMEWLKRCPEILEILEIKFWTGVEHNFIHCAWLIVSKDEEYFFFDPTGVQFGADWALLTPWYTYFLEKGTRREDKQYYLDEFACYPLGWNRRSLEVEENRAG